MTASAGNGNLISEIDVRAYVTKSGDLGLWLTTATPLPINQMLIGKVATAARSRSRSRATSSSRCVGVKSAIRVLRFTLNARG